MLLGFTDFSVEFWLRFRVVRAAGVHDIVLVWSFVVLLLVCDLKELLSLWC